MENALRGFLTRIKSVCESLLFFRSKHIDSKIVCLQILLVNLLLALIKFVAGILGNSVVLIADAVHSLSDVLSSGGVLWALKVSHKPADQNHPSGHGKIESIATKMIALVLIAAGIGMLVSAYQQVARGEYFVPLEVAVWAAIISIVTKELSFHYVNFMAKKLNSTVLKADAWHHRSDAFSSFVALAGILGARLGYPALDPLLAAMVSLLVVWMGLKLLRTAVDELMDAMPDPNFSEKLCALGEDVEGVKEVREVKVRRYGSSLIIDLVIAVDGDITVSEGHSLAVAVKEVIKNNMASLEVEDVFIHVSPYVEG